MFKKKLEINVMGIADCWLFFRRNAYWLWLPIAIPVFTLRMLKDYLDKKKWPRTIDHAVDILINNMTEEEQNQLIENPDDSWFSLGQSMRNKFGLWQGNHELIKSCGVSDQIVPADHASSVILQKLIERIKSQNLNQ